jgi:hypothetical protein
MCAKPAVIQPKPRQVSQIRRPIQVTGQSAAPKIRSRWITQSDRERERAFRTAGELFSRGDRLQVSLFGE